MASIKKTSFAGRRLSPHLNESENEFFRGKKIHLQPLVIDRSFIGVIPHKKRKTTLTLPFGAVYMLHAKGTDLYKIGVTGNFVTRFRDLSSASPLPLVCIHFYTCDNPYSIEEGIHKLIEELRFKNEWFLLEGNDFNLVNDLFNSLYANEKEYRKSGKAIFSI